MRASVFSRTRQTSPSSQGGSILIHSWTRLVTEFEASGLRQVGDRLRFAECKVRVLEERLRLVQIEKFGPGSENSPTTNWNCRSWVRVLLTHLPFLGGIC